MSSFKEINDLLFEFLWARKRGKIKRSEMISTNYGDGQNVGHHAGHQVSKDLVDSKVYF